jgi:hypothetical protein
MEDPAPVCKGLAEAGVFLRYFEPLQDPRQPGKVADPLDEILLPCLLAVLAGAETIVDIALFGRKKALLPALPALPALPGRSCARYSQLPNGG